MKKPLVIEYYTDVLCVWAWIAQQRIDELNKKLEGLIELQHYYVNIFGDVSHKINTQWDQKGGFKGFADHVQESAKVFEYATINPKIWNNTRPTTSANAHLVLKAIEISYNKEKSIDMALSIRKAFFVDALDISNLETLYDLMTSNGLDQSKIISHIHDGSAIAALMNDYKKSEQHNIKGSPTYVIDGGRQTLYGNVGFRVLKANIDEVLKQPIKEASWC